MSELKRWGRWRDSPDEASTRKRNASSRGTGRPLSEKTALNWELFIARNEGCCKFPDLSTFAKHIFYRAALKYNRRVQKSFMDIKVPCISPRLFKEHHVRQEVFRLLFCPPSPHPLPSRAKMCQREWQQLQLGWRDVGPIAWWFLCQHFGCILHILQKFHQYPKKPSALMRPRWNN